MENHGGGKASSKWAVAVLAAVFSSVATVGVNQLFNNPAMAERLVHVEKDLNQHLDVYVPIAVKESQDERVRIAVLEQRLGSIEKQLDELKEGQHRLLRAAGLNGDNSRR